MAKECRLKCIALDLCVVSIVLLWIKRTGLAKFVVVM